MKTILVTGGAGFIGTNLVEALLQRGDKVLLVDNFNVFYNPAVKRDNISKILKHANCTLYKADIAQPHQMYPVFTNNKIDCVIHLAGRTSVQESMKNPLIHVRDNVGGTAVLLDMCSKFGIKEFIFASTSSVYGDSPNFPYTEDMTINNPISPYGSTKRACELIVSNYASMFGIKTGILRIFTAFGPRNRPDMAVYRFAEMIKKDQPVTVYRREKEHVYRDWIYIDDVVKAFIGLIDSLEKQKAKFEIYNIGNTEAVPIQHMVFLLGKHLGKEPIVKYSELPPGDPPITASDISKLEDLIGPIKITPLDEGVKKFVEWFQKQSL